jgi:cation diffusion facilitator CzcD-associated flavoprotein CzcO
MAEHLTQTVIIGAGPAGLALAGRFTHEGLPYVLLEKSNQVGHAWHHHYDRLHLHTVKQHSALPYLPFPASYPTYVSRQQLIDYFELYCRHFDIQPRLEQEVKVVRRQGKQWVVHSPTDTYFCERVVIATGYNRRPKQPTWPEQETFSGTWQHSHVYRNGAAFGGKRVLVVGIGNTGAEIALDLYEHGAEPYVSVRGPVNIIKRDVLGRPAQVSAIMLSKLGPKAYDWFAKRIQRWTVGDLSAYGIQTPALAPSAQVRLTGKIPVIDFGTVALIKQQKIKIVPDIQRIEPNQVVFVDGQKLPFDAVILATGYRPAVEDFLENAATVLNERGYPSALWFDDDAHDELYFLGFALPTTGILRNINLDSAKVFEQIQRRVKS